jgi:hypothetical protein
MAAIFYDAVAGSTPVKKLSYEAKTPDRIAVIIEGKNPGYAVGDKVTYKALDGYTLSGAIVQIYVAPIQTAWPNGYFALYMVAGTNAAVLNGKIGGTVFPVTVATPVKAPVPANAQPPVVSASTILKGGGTAAPAPAVPEIPAAKASLLPFGLTTKAILAAGIVGVAAFLLTRKGKGKKG